MKTVKPKMVSYTLIPETSDIGEPMYQLLYDLLAAHHDAINNVDVRVALAWATSWKADVDGRLTLGKCKKASDLDRELAPYDFVILLNRDFWQNPRVTDTQRRALLDHELMHAALSYDDNGDPKRDERGRSVFRIRKHDVEEFADIVSRYGCYKRDLEYFASALRRAEAHPLIDAAEPSTVVDAAERFVAATPPATSCTLTLIEDGKPVGDPVRISAEDGEAARRRMAGR